MVIDFFTLLLALFVLVMYLYLILLRKSILIKSQKKRRTYLLVISISLLILLMSIGLNQTLDQRIRSFLSCLLVLSFTLDVKGFSEDRLILGTFDHKGVLYQDIDKVALLIKNNEIRLNYFKNGYRGPMLRFSIPLEELLDFLSRHLNEHAEVTILVDEDNQTMR